jgi:hypothetical protein
MTSPRDSARFLVRGYVCINGTQRGRIWPQTDRGIGH